MDPVGARVLRCGNGHGEFRVIGSVWGLPGFHCLIHMRLQGSRKAWRRTAHPRQHLRIHHEGGRRDGQVALRDQPTGTDDVWAKAREVEGKRAPK